MKSFKKSSAAALILALCLTISAFACAVDISDFIDVPDTAWYRGELTYATEHNIINGTSKTTFSPNLHMKRCEFITILGRAMNGTAQSRGKFTDVNDSSYYAPYLYWGVENGIINGTSDSTFSPDLTISRQDMASLIWRTIDKLGLNISEGSGAAAQFGDYNSISAYARQSADYLRRYGIIKGDNYGNFNPRQSVTRAEGMSVLVRTLTRSSGTDIPDPPTPTPADGIEPLHVEGINLADRRGNIVQLRGVSTHGLAWFPQYVNYDAFRTLRDDWGANVIRLAMYTAEYGGYCNGGDRSALKELIDKGVNYASDLGMYVIIDWHILSDGNPMTHAGDAEAFFREMSKKYADRTNVIYEICNEPQSSPWESVIYPYAERITKAIRENDSDAIIIVGTNTWSQDVDEVIGKRLPDSSTVYAFHFYAATHKDYLRDKLKRALDAGIPVFVSECGVSEASGYGGVDTASANLWLEIFSRYKISFVAWDLCNKNETAALIKPDCNKLSDWSDSDLTASGIWFKYAIKG